ncbi:MAG: glycosyltransferase [Minicystis sp.]
MRFVVFGLTVSSSWGNGHATLWRGLIRALARLGHKVTFFERDVPYYAKNRDLERLEHGELRLYEAWEPLIPEARAALAGADVAMVTSYCPDGVAAAELVLDSRARSKVFYDLDTPVTLALARAGQRPAYLGPNGLGRFDLVLSYTGGAALDDLRAILGARRVAPLYGSVDPDVYRAAPPRPEFRADLSYLGTWAADRVQPMEQLLVDVARVRPERRFLVGGALYPASYPWPSNVARIEHVAPPDHPAFFCSSRVSLSITRAVMASLGYCPSGRLFEAAACGACIVSDHFEGLDRFFAPGREILVARSTADVLAVLDRSDEELSRIGHAARERVLAEHTADRRARELCAAVEAGGR